MSMNFAHRGFSAAFPENTMPAFEEAVKAGCDGIELDARLSRDGKIVISHDGSLERMAGRPGHVRDYTLDELRAFNFCGSHPEAGFVPIATLEEYFSFIRTTDVVTNIEIKSDVGNFLALEDACIDLIRRFSLEEKIIFSSFNHDSMLYCKRRAPEIRTGLLFGTSWSTEFSSLSPAAYARLCHADYLHPHASGMSPRDVLTAQLEGIGVNVWTVNDEETMRAYIDVGTHGVISNHPDVLHKLLK